MDLTNLRFFYHVAQHLSFTKAALDLSVKQPSVTRRVKLLEEELGLQLFGLRRGKSYLTEEGMFLYEHAKKIMEYNKEFENVASEVRELKRGILKLSVHKTFLDTNISFTMEHFQKRYPDVKIRVNTGTALEVMHSVLDHRDEIAIHAKVEEHPDIEYLHISRLEVALIVSPDHRFVGKKAVSVKELDQEPIILTEIGSGTRKVVLELFERNRITPYIFLESSHIEHIKQLVQQGNGVSFLPERVVAPEIKNRKVVKIHINKGKIFLDTYIFYLKSFPLTLPAIAYLKLFAEVAPSIPNYPDLIPTWSKNCRYIYGES